jgi:hypothetical protein
MYSRKPVSSFCQYVYVYSGLIPPLFISAQSKTKRTVSIQFIYRL